MKNRSTKKELALPLFLILFAVLLAACGSGATSAEPAQVQAVENPTPPPPTAAPLQTEMPPTDPPPAETTAPELIAEERGREIFFNGGKHDSYTPERSCSTCHSLDGTVSAKGDTGPSLLGIAARAGERVPGLSAAAYIRQSIMDTPAYVTPGYPNRMNKLGSRYLDEQELDDLVAFLLTLTGNTVLLADIKPTPEVELDLGMDIAEGNDTRGRIAANSYRCLHCHGDEEVVGYGPPFASTDAMPPIMERGELRIADPAYTGQAATNQEYVLESIFLPAAYSLPGEWVDTMPNTYHEYMTEEELDNIMAWLSTFE